MQNFVLTTDKTIINKSKTAVDAPLLLSFKSVKGFEVLDQATQRSGLVADLLVDDRTWGIRYLVVRPGTLLPGRPVLVRPERVESIDMRQPRFELDRNVDVLERAPALDYHAPVSRRMRKLGSLLSWTASPVNTPAQAAVGPAVSVAEAATAPGDPHLRSVKELIGYRFATEAGADGRIADVVADVAGWRLAWFVVSPRRWWPGRKVLVAPQHISSVDWMRRRVHSSLTHEQLDRRPVFRAGEPVNWRQETVVYDYRGNPQT